MIYLFQIPFFLQLPQLNFCSNEKCLQNLAKDVAVFAARIKKDISTADLPSILTRTAESYERNKSEIERQYENSNSNQTNKMNQGVDDFDESSWQNEVDYDELFDLHETQNVKTETKSIQPQNGNFKISTHFISFFQKFRSENRTIIIS